MTHRISEAELQEIYAFALDLGRQAGKILLDGIEQRTGEMSGRGIGPMEEKMNAVDIVRSTTASFLLQNCSILTQKFRSRKPI